MLPSAQDGPRSRRCQTATREQTADGRDPRKLNGKSFRHRRRPARRGPIHLHQQRKQRSNGLPRFAACVAVLAA